MTGHAPIPWMVDGITVASGAQSVCYMGEPAQWSGDTPRMLDNCDANAALIVRAVNSHEALIEALREIARHPHSGIANAGYQTPREIALAALQQAKAGDHE